MLSGMRELRWGTIGLVALLAVDLVLVVAAVWPSSAPAVSAAGASAGGSTAPVESPQATATASASTSPTPSPSPTAVDAVPLTRLVASVGRQVAWVVDTGSCDQRGTVRVTTDGGASWTKHAAPGYVTRVRPSSASAAFTVGGGDGCSFVLWSTSDGGGSWSGPQSAQAAWGRSPTDPTLVERPGGDPVRACARGADVVDLTGSDRANAAVLCSDGRVRETSNGGGAWRTVVERDGALALSWGGGGSGVLAGTGDGCEGVLVVPVEAGTAGTPTCVEKLTPVAGEVAVSQGGGGLWLVAGDQVATASSPDGPWTVVAGSVG